MLRGGSHGVSGYTVDHRRLILDILWPGRMGYHYGRRYMYNACSRVYGKWARSFVLSVVHGRRSSQFPVLYVDFSFHILYGASCHRVYPSYDIRRLRRNWSGVLLTNLVLVYPGQRLTERYPSVSFEPSRGPSLDTRYGLVCNNKLFLGIWHS